MPATDSAALKHRAQALQLHGVLSHCKRSANDTLAPSMTAC